MLLDRWKYFVGVITTIIVLVVGQIFVYGQFTSNVKTHIDNRIIHTLPENLDKYITHDEFVPYQKQLDRIEIKLDLLNDFLLKHDRKNP